MRDEKNTGRGAHGLGALLTSATRANVFGAALATATSLGLFGIVMLIFGPARYARSIEAAYGVATGHPFWRTFQSRVLGPYFIKALALGSTENYTAAYISFHIVSMAVGAFLCWRLGRKYSGSERSALTALLLFIFFFVSLLSPPWLYVWDFLDIVVFFVFIDFVLSERPLAWFVGLFAVAIWNRDSADFIALWLILDPLVRHFYQRRDRRSAAPLEWKRMLAGALCIAAGLIIAAVLKHTLLIEETAAVIPTDTPLKAGATYNFVLPVNIEILRHEFFTIRVLFAIAFIAAAVSLGLKFARLDPYRYLGLYLTELALVAAALVFGIINELRIFLVLLPFVVATAVLALPVARPHAPMAKTAPAQ